MRILLYLSDFMIPLVILYVVLIGLASKVSIFDAFTKGAEDGFKVVLGILPTLIGLMMAVSILRTSGVLDYVAQLLGNITGYLHFPGELVPLVLVKMFSSSAATGLLLDVFKEYGADSYFGLLSSVLMSCSETIFYTMSVYFMAAGVTKTRYTLSGALAATLAGIIASTMLISLV